MTRPAIFNLAASGGGGAITSASGVLGADVAIGTALTFVDGPTVSLAAGTWFVLCFMTIASSTATGAIIGRLWDGTTVFGSSEVGDTSTTFPMEVVVAAIVTPGSTTTYRGSATVSTGTGTIKAATPTAGQGNTASQILAIKLA